ncbi:hypothetical protein M426DRAFT_315884 [Hypoxylon sp. CI-4A]|nr:hypothetical protein M426DRAFT_315884 [Hypoxylon sp. CI-4A]
MNGFEYDANPARVVFGSGTVKKVPQELARAKVSKPFLLSTPQQVSHIDLLKSVLGDAVSGTFSGATMHTPVEVTERALDQVKSSGADSIISIGGGSTVGLGKALSIRTGLFHLAIPTTYAGSEVTPILGETDAGRKTTRNDPKILPDAVVYDVDFTMTLPVSLTATSGVNAIAHAVEALYSRDTNPIMNVIAQEGVKALAKSLPILVSEPSSREARTSALYGAWICGICLGSVGMSIHHKLCHTLGGSFNLPHSETHTIILPHALSYNAPKVPAAMEALAAVLPGSEGDATKGLNILLNKLKVKRGLKALGMQESDIDKAADIAVSNPYWNPRPIERGPIRELIRRAWAGEEARADL